MLQVGIFLLLILLTGPGGPEGSAFAGSRHDGSPVVAEAGNGIQAGSGHADLAELLELRGRVHRLRASLSVIAILLIVSGVLLYFELRSRARMNRILKDSNRQLSGQKDDLVRTLDYLAESEEKYRSLVENAPTGILLIDPGGSILEVNARMIDILGSPGVGETRQINCMEFPPLKEIGLSDDLMECIRTERSLRRRVEYRTKWGKQVSLHYTITPVRGAQGTVSRLILNAEDITEAMESERSRLEAEQRYLHQLEESEKALKELNAMKDKFFSIIAHDLKNPFNSILGLSSLLNEAYDNFPEKQRKAFIKNICEASENTFKLLQNLLEWSRTQTGQIEYNPRMLHLEPLVIDNIAILKSGFARKQIEVLADLDREIKAYADENMVKLVLRNLLANALKFTHPGGRVEVFAESRGPEAVITVKDNGVGLSEENLQKIFRIDFHLKTRGTASESGSGLGLILCKEFIQKNRGRIWAISEPGRGSSFSFSLPAEEPAR